MSYKLVIAEKPSVAQSIAKVIGADKREDGYLEGNGYLVSWCVGHLAELAPPEAYDEKYEKWRYSDLPILPSEWKYQISDATRKQFGILKKLMEREDVTGLVEATDAGREGELIFRLVYHQAKCKKHSSVYGFLPWKTRRFRMAFLICKTEKNMMIFIGQLYAESVQIGSLV